MICLLLLIVYRTLFVNFEYNLTISNLNNDGRIYLLRKLTFRSLYSYDPISHSNIYTCGDFNW